MIKRKRKKKNNEKGKDIRYMCDPYYLFEVHKVVVIKETERSWTFLRSPYMGCGEKPIEITAKKNCEFTQIFKTFKEAKIAALKGIKKRKKEKQKQLLDMENKRVVLKKQKENDVVYWHTGKKNL